MFGFSFAELIVVFLAILFFIKPEDLPQIARFFGKFYYRARKLFDEIKLQLKNVENDLGINEIKQEMHIAIVEEKLKDESEKTEIIDIYGKSHQVYDVEKIRPDLTKQELGEEIEKYNDINKYDK
jgi:Sec-independent protein translocase protein TatA